MTEVRSLLGGKLKIFRSDLGLFHPETFLPRKECPECGSPNCVYQCDLSRIAPMAEEENEVAARLRYNGGLDALESLVLELASAGVNFPDDAVQTVLTAMENEFDGLGEKFLERMELG